MYIAFLLVASSCSNSSDPIYEIDNGDPVIELIVPRWNVHWTIDKVIEGKDTTIFKEGNYTYLNYFGDDKKGELHICSETGKDILNYEYTITSDKAIEFRKNGKVYMEHLVDKVNDKIIHIRLKDQTNKKILEIFARDGDIVGHI